MKLALGFNPILDVSEQTKLASKADAAGYDSIWMHESLFQRDVVTYISSKAQATSRIRLGSGVINTYTRHPVAAATTFATLSEVSGGRVNLGLGLGSFPTVPMIGHQVFPVEKTLPLRRIREYLEVMKMIWNELHEPFLVGRGDIHHRPDYLVNKKTNNMMAEVARTTWPTRSG